MTMLKSLRAKLFFWYLASLTFLAAFLYFFVHEYAWIHGTHIFLSLYAILALSGFGIIYRITHSLDNLSARMRTITYKNLDERIPNAGGEDEISLLARTFNKLLDRLDEAFKREQQFISDVTHELKTPLATLRSSLELGLEKKRTADEYQKILSSAIEETNNLSSTIKSILDLAWSESGTNEQDMKKINLSELLEELLEIVQKLSKSKKIIVHSSISKDVYILGYKEKLAHALLNILDNAVKYNLPGGKLSINLERVYDQAIIIVKDSGAGIAEEDLERIFDRFYRGSKTSKIFGSGLGLAISKSIITLHKGDIRVNSKAGIGTTFTINIPTTNQSS